VNPDSDSLANRMVWIRGHGPVRRHCCLFALVVPVWRHLLPVSLVNLHQNWIRESRFGKSNTALVSLNRLPASGGPRPSTWGIRIVSTEETVEVRETSHNPACVHHSRGILLAYLLKPSIRACSLLHVRRYCTAVSDISTRRHCHSSSLYTIHVYMAYKLTGLVKK